MRSALHIRAISGKFTALIHERAISCRPGQEKAFYRAIPAGSPFDAVPRGQAFRMMRRCLVAKCFNGNNGDEEKPRATLKCALTPNEASRLA